MSSVLPRRILSLVVYNGGFRTDGTSGLSYFNFASVVEIRLWFYRSYFNFISKIEIMIKVTFVSYHKTSFVIFRHLSSSFVIFRHPSSSFVIL